MTFRRSALTASALALALVTSAAAQAGTRTGGIPLVGGGSNSVVANNIAAGHGNTAQQSVFANQFSASPFHGRTLGGTNSTQATNLAAGEHNQAHQGVMANQFGGGGVSPYFAPQMGGGSNSVTANNIAAGINNTAIQGVGALQGPGGNNRVDATNLAAGMGNFASQQVLTTQR